MPENNIEELGKRDKKIQELESELRNLKASLSESEERFNTIMENLPGGIFAHDLDGRIIFANDMAVQQTGYSKDELLKMAIMDLDPNLSRESNLINFWQDLKVRKPISFDAELIRKDGSRYTAEVYLSAITLDRQPVFWGIAFDITKRKSFEEALKESEKRYRGLFENSTDFIYTLDLNGSFTDVNKAAEDITGYTKDELIGMNYKDYTSESAQARIYEAFNKIITDGKYLKDFPLEVTVKDGEKKYLETCVSPLKKEDKIIGFQGSSRDVTQRIQAEEEREKLQAQLSNALEIAHLGPWEYDLNNDLFTFNDYFYKMFRTTAEKMGGYTMSYSEYIQNFVHPDDVYLIEEETKKEFQTKDTHFLGQIEHRIIYGDGEIGHIAVRIFIVKDEHGKFVKSYGVNQDITERKRAEKEKKENEEKFIRYKKMESLGLLAGGVAHDLNNVLAGIVSYPDLLLMDLPEDSKYRKPILTIQESGNKAVAIVQDLLTIARGVVTAKEPLNLNIMVKEYLTSPEFKKLKQIHPFVQVTTELDSALFNIMGSLSHIRKIIMNLVSNATEAIEDSGDVNISTRNCYLDKPMKGYENIKMGEYAILSVSDNGSGIAPNYLARIFEPFFTRKVIGRSGTGLGLAVVWNILKDHNGYINILSNEIGTIFELYFPITRDEIIYAKSHVHLEELQGNGETILVIDDVESQREITCTMLDALNYKNTAVSSGEEAVEYLKSSKADLILLDMIMEPGMDGRETYERIIKMNPQQKAIIVSGFAETDDVKETQKMGAGQYVKKPFTTESIGMALKKELEKL